MGFRLHLLAAVILAGALSGACRNANGDDDNRAASATLAPGETAAASPASGEGDLSAYFGQLDDAQRAVSEGFEAGVLGATDAKAALDAFAALASAYRDRLEGLEPPGVVAAEHQRLAQAADDLVDTLESLADAASASEPVAAVEAVLSGEGLFDEVDRASCALTQIAEAEGIALTFFACNAPGSGVGE
jgi:hypothetical protein